MKPLFLTLAFVLFPFTFFAQSYTPVDTANQAMRMQISKEYLKNIKLFKVQIKSEYNGSAQTNILNHYEKVHKQFNEDLLNGVYIYDQRFNKMIDRIVAELKSKNKNIPENIQFFISKDLSLNASSLGDNYFVINLGTFYYLQNEEQLASIIAHEIGHLLLKHSYKSIQRYHLTLKEEAKKQTKEVKREKSNKSEKAWNKLKQILYEESSFNRKQEYESDSIGYVLFRNTSFNRTNYINTLKGMDLYDSIKPMGLNNEIYKRVFDLPAQPFKEEWLKQEDFKSYDYSKYKERMDEDSVDTHPKTKERIANIKRIFPELVDEGQPVQGSAFFDSLQSLAKASQPFCLDYQEEYGYGVYICLLRLQEDEKDPFYRYWLGEFFSKIYDARKRYTLNRYLDRIAPKEQSESYQQFLSFMWNLSLNEIKNIKDYYKKGS
ncbi:MAG: M48 family metallopeptidase [Bacteroidales bacterium]|nr:M48 family metallopeptidase [Bacteroidales bacterium]